VRRFLKIEGGAPTFGLCAQQSEEEPEVGKRMSLSRGVRK